MIEALLLPRENKPFGPDRSPEVVKNPTRNQEGMLLSFFLGGKASVLLNKEYV